MRTIGRPLATPVKLDLSGLAGLNFYEPEELVLSAKAGTRRSEIDELLRGRRQAFAFEPPDFARLLGSNQGGTLGGMIAANLSGPRRIRSGALRDHILGFSAVSGRGEAFQCGGRVMKNVTGYDLPKLMAGSWGTLCALTEVTMKVMPAPETTATLLLFGFNDEDAGAAMRDAMRSPLDIAGAAHLPVDVARASALADIANAGTSVTLLRLEGFGESVAFRLAELQARFTAERSVLDPQRSETAWSEIRDVHLLAEPRERIVWRVSLPPSDGPRAMNHIRTAAPAAIGYYDWAGGSAVGVRAALRAWLDAGRPWRHPAGNRPCDSDPRSRKPARIGVRLRAASGSPGQADPKGKAGIRSVRGSQSRPHVPFCLKPCRPTSPPPSSPTRRSPNPMRSSANASIAASAPRPARPMSCSAMSSIRRAAASI